MELDLTTKLSRSTNTSHKIRGHDITELIATASLTDVLFLLWRGDLPQPKEKKLMEAMLVASTEHGVSAPSAFVPRVVASTGNAMNAALAASALTVSEKHGGAIEAAAFMLVADQSPQDIVTERLAQKRPLPGLGHKVYKKKDPRAEALAAKATQLKFRGGYFAKLEAIAHAFAEAKGKRLPINVDGALACGLLELHLDPRVGKALFIIPRLIGATAHVLEEYDQGKSYRRLAKRKTK